MKVIIESGIEMDNLEKKLTKVGDDGENWLIYYLDEETKEKWVKEYPKSGMHGGGRPQLRRLENFPWE